MFREEDWTTECDTARTDANYMTRSVVTLVYSMGGYITLMFLDASDLYWVVPRPCLTQVLCQRQSCRGNTARTADFFYWAV